MRRQLKQAIEISTLKGYTAPRSCVVVQASEGGWTSRSNWAKKYTSVFTKERVGREKKEEKKREGEREGEKREESHLWR